MFGAFGCPFGCPLGVECELGIAFLGLNFLGFGFLLQEFVWVWQWAADRLEVEVVGGGVMDLLVLFPLEFLANLPGSKPVVDVDTTRVKKLRPKKTSEEEEEKSDELKVEAKLRFEFTKIPALLSLKPN